MILRTAATTIIIFFIVLVISFSFYFLKEGLTLSSENLLLADISNFVLEEENVKEKTLHEVAQGFLNKPYKRNPLEDNDTMLYRTDVFDCTTFVLSTVAKKKAGGGDPRKIIKKINYYPENNISYETRNHFSTYRNQVSPFFEDITKEVGADVYKEEKLLLNKMTENGRIINIDWEEEMIINYILTDNVTGILNSLPNEVGVGFVREEKFQDGLDIVHEGFVFNKTKFVHASESAGRVIEEDFINYLSEGDYTGVLFYKII